MEQMSQITFTTQDMQDIIKKCQTMFFFSQHHKKAKIMPNYDVPNGIFPCQMTLKRSNFCNLALKMPTWQPWPVASSTTTYNQPLD